MTSVAHASRGVTRSPHPSWRDAFVATFLGWALAGFAVGALYAVAWELGLVGRPFGSGLRDWPYPEAGWASLVANVVVWLWILAATALLIRGLLADRSARPLSAAIVFVVVLVTGFAPVPHGLLEPSWPVGLIITAALLRLAPGAGPDPLPKRTTAKLIAVGTTLLVIPAGHGLLHPLWPGGITGYQGSPDIAALSLRNAGFADVALESVSLRMPVPIVELVSVQASGAPFDRATSRLPFVLESRSETFLQLRLRHLGCGDGPPLRGEARVRYRVYGLRRTETLPVEVSPRPC